MLQLRKRCVKWPVWAVTELHKHGKYTRKEQPSPVVQPSSPGETLLPVCQSIIQVAKGEYWVHSGITTPTVLGASPAPFDTRPRIVIRIPTSAHDSASEIAISRVISPLGRPVFGPEVEEE